MLSKICLLLVFIATSVAPALPASARRIAIIEAGGQPASSNQGIAAMESRLADALNSKLAGQPGVTLVDRASIDRIIKEQNAQFSDRFSADAAVRIGKLLGAQQMVLVHVTDANWSTNQQNSNGGSKVTGTVILRANVRLVDVESAVILSQPASSFEESVPVSETSRSQGFQAGLIRVPARQKTSGGDPKVIADDEVNKAVNAVSSDLAGKLTGSITSAPVAAPNPITALVAGIAGGEVYINQGANGGVRAGQKFQITRMVSVGLNDPTTGQPILKRQTICVLTIVDVQETNASGDCQGGLPQSKDIAEPVSP
ncbi:MAG TPA: CsgG/HfaB family protein [Acidobacteriaceae bacterium]|nr:CsgG/HfaB family protein [Acidobacteriaceae bacterium]